MRKTSSFIVVLLFFGTLNFCSGQSAPDSVKLNGKYFLGYFKDTYSIITSPATWDEKDWQNFGVTGAVAFTSFMFDKDMIHWMEKTRSDGTNTLSDFFEPLGRSSSFMPFSLVIGTYGIGAIIKDYRLKKASLLALESFAISGFFVQAFKFGVNRNRPGYGHRSFPSGHTAAVFAVASVFSYEYRDKKWLPPLLYSVATITALSRINDLRHYPSDVVIGFAMGYFMGRHIAKIHDGPRKQNLTVVPAYFDKRPMIGLIYKFN